MENSFEEKFNNENLNRSYAGEDYLATISDLKKKLKDSKKSSISGNPLNNSQVVKGSNKFSK